MFIETHDSSQPRYASSHTDNAKLPSRVVNWAFQCRSSEIRIMQLARITHGDEYDAVRNGGSIDRASQLYLL